MILKHHLKTKVSPARVILLGGSGFIGKNLTSHLTKLNIEVKSFSSKELDLTNKESVQILKSTVKETDAVVFLSALTPDKGKDTATTMRNLTMAQNVADFVEQSKFSHFISIGSDAIYADDILPEGVTEETACAPSTLYGLTHLVRELIIKAAVAKAKVPAVFVRPCAVYGAGDTHNSYGPNRFLRTAIKDRKITLFGEGEEKRDHILVDDLSKLIILCLQHKSEGVINAVGGRSYSFMEVAQEVKSLVGDDVKIECMPRASAITYRHFNVTDRIKSFPEFQPTSLKTGLKNFKEGSI